MGNSGSHVTPGTVLAGKYRVDEVLGEGGMGVVVRATHTLLDEPVALKFLQPQLARDPDASARFLREAKAAMRIRGQHVAQVLDVGKLNDGAPYIVMEYLRGQDLEAMLEARGALPVAEAVDAVLQACRALHDAHGAGVVHRDIKPANLFATTNSSGQQLIKVLDFGISKMSGEKVDKLTKPNTMMGSALYMSPEQLVSSRDVDYRTDIYALGVTLYQLLTGDFPYMGETMPQLVAQVLKGNALPLRQFRADVPAELEAVIARAIAREPADRHRSINALAADLAPFASASARSQLASFLALDEALPSAAALAPHPTVPGAPPDDALVNALPASDAGAGESGEPSTSAVEATGSGAIKRSAAPILAAPTLDAPTRAAPTLDGPSVAGRVAPAAIAPTVIAAAAPPVPASAAVTVVPVKQGPDEASDATEEAPAARAALVSSPEPAEAQPAEAQPTETQPAEVQPVGAQLASTAAPTSRNVASAHALPIHHARRPWLLAAGIVLLSVAAGVAFVSFGTETSTAREADATTAATAGPREQAAMPPAPKPLGEAKETRDEDRHGPDEGNAGETDSGEADADTAASSEAPSPEASAVPGAAPEPKVKRTPPIASDPFATTNRNARPRPKPAPKRNSGATAKPGSTGSIFDSFD